MIVYETKCERCGAEVKREATSDEEIRKLQAEIFKEPQYCNFMCKYPPDIYWD